MSKVVWHLGGWSNNWGDRALQVGTSQMLKDVYDGDLQFVYVDNQKTYFSENLIEKMNDEADLLLIGGGGYIFHRPEDNGRSGWQFNIDTENISKIKAPIAVYGVGYNKFPHDDREFPDQTWESIQRVIDLSHVFSVRNVGTYEALENHHIDLDNVTVVPDAAMFVKPYKFNHASLANDKLKIGLNIATDRWEMRFGKEPQEILSTVLGVCKEAAEKYDAEVYLIEHLMPNDLNKDNKEYLRSRAKEILGDRGHIMFEEMYEEMYPPFDYTAPMFADLYRQMDLVVAMRGHANIIPFGQNTPCIGIGEHNKVKWFLDDVDLKDLYVPLDRDTELNINKLRNAIDDVVSNIDEYKYNMSLKMAQLEIIKSTFVNRIAEVLK